MGINIYVKNKRKTDFNFKLTCNIGTRTNKAFRSQNIRKTNKTFHLLRCCNSFLTKWIIHQLYGEMTLENYVKIGCLDHCYPLSKANLSHGNYMYKSTILINLRPMYIRDNIIKGDKIDCYLYLLQEVKAKYFMKMVKRDLTNIFMDEIYSKPPMKNYPTNKIIYNHLDEIWSIVLADMIDYKISNNKGFRYIFVIMGKFSKYLWAIL